MMSSMVRSLIFLVLLCAISGYLFYLKTGILPFPNRILTSSGEGGGRNLRRLSEMPALNSVEREVAIQKWQDDKGVWHFSNEQKK
ncbi:MAG: hypothetical protein QNK31_04570 [Porticoccus sp.]|nr:hypothetical protein [Porticoccus sp.]